jgi:23S rRNA (uracil1939-C5)-methyltransferase
MTIDPGADLELRPSAIAVGGDAVSRTSEGQVVFVNGALPGELVRARVRSVHTRYAHADVVQVLEPSVERVEPECPHVGRGCGGCPWAHVAPGGQRDHKRGMIAEALERLGGLDDPAVDAAPALVDVGYRTTVRAAVVDGRAGYHLMHSDQRLAVDSCRIAHPLVETMLVDGRFDAADEVTLRAGASTGERMARVAPRASDVVLPDDVLVVGADELASGRRAWIHEEIAGITFRISADSFFQSRPDGAAALVDQVGRALHDAEPGAPMVDLYGGVGLFAATIGRERRVVLVERARSSVADARVNLADLEATIVGVAVERWRPSPAGVVVADPPRGGLGKRGVDHVSRTGAGHLALVSCDAGSLGRDAGLLVAAGWRHEWSTLVDLFPDTPHVEVVSRFVR